VVPSARRSEILEEKARTRLRPRLSGSIGFIGVKLVRIGEFRYAPSISRMKGIS
jgi:hypothetical protein